MHQHLFHPKAVRLQLPLRVCSVDLEKQMGLCTVKICSYKTYFLVE